MKIIALGGGGVKRFAPLALCILGAVLVSGCGPTITVKNRTRFPVTATVRNGERHETLSPSPGESSSMDADTGPYFVYAVPEKDWLEYAKLTRKVLNESLADPSRLTGPQINDIVQRLKDIAERIQQYEGTAGGARTCQGTISESGAGGTVEITVGADGGLVARCY